MSMIRDMPLPTLGEIPRNNIPKAVEYVRAKLEQNGRVPPEEVRVLYQLQDDPMLLVKALQKLDAERKAKGLAGLT